MRIASHRIVPRQKQVYRESVQAERRQNEPTPRTTNVPSRSSNGSSLNGLATISSSSVERRQRTSLSSSSARKKSTLATATSNPKKQQQQQQQPPMRKTDIIENWENSRIHLVGRPSSLLLVRSFVRTQPKTSSTLRAVASNCYMLLNTKGEENK